VGLPSYWHKVGAWIRARRGEAAASARRARRSAGRAAARLRGAQVRARALQARRRLRDLGYLLRLERTVTFAQLGLGFWLARHGARPEEWLWLTGVVACLGPMLYGGLYALNDVHDCAQDRLNPQKRDRPVAAGRIAAAQAQRLGVGLVALALLAALALGVKVFVLALAFAALNGLYTQRLKHVWGWDLVGNAATHVLRLAGGMWLGGTWSHGLLLLGWGLPALALCALRRRHELSSAPVAARPVLARYRAESLERMMAACFWGALALWQAMTGIDFVIGAAGLGLTLGLVYGYAHVPAVRQLENLLWR
jgi:4-hydroxybenzoate polyprenyltransferase